MKTRVTRAGMWLWLAGMLVLLAAWVWCCDPGRVGAVPALVGRVARRFGHGGFDAATGVWSAEEFWLRLQLTRLAILLTAATGLGLGVVHHRTLRAKLAAFFTEPRSAIDLAVLRIVVFATIYLETPTGFIRMIASLPPELQFPPETGMPRLGPLGALAYWPLYPFSGEQVGMACTALKAACVLGILGICSRASALIVSLLFFGAWGSIQWFGKVDHHHHLLWFALLLAASRSGDALSVDAWWAGRRGGSGFLGPVRPSSTYGMPLAFCMLLVGVLYFFPGFWKLAHSGLDWALSENLKYTMYMKWYGLGGWTPSFRIDRHPLLYMAGGLAVLLFETTFIFLVVDRRTRLLAALYGLAFHFGTARIMQISFWTLRNCYVMFFEWGRLLGKRRTDEPAVPDEWPRAVIVVGTVLVVGNLWAGALAKMDGWPLACYPLFHGIVGESYETMEIELVRRDGSLRRIVADDYDGALGERWGNLLGKILDNRDAQRKQEQMRVVWRLIAARDPTLADGTLVRFESVETWLAPERWHDPPRRRRVIYEFPL